MNPENLIIATEQVLRQGLDLLGEVDAISYRTPLGPPFGASVGQHYRHVLDHFLCFVEGLTTGRIDFDRRRRELALQQDLHYARQATEALIARLARLQPKHLYESCLVQYAVGYGDMPPQTILSHFGRELAYCVSHAVHHYAIVRLLCAQLNVEVPTEFGVAPSTLQHHARQIAH